MINIDKMTSEIRSFSDVSDVLKENKRNSEKIISSFSHFDDTSSDHGEAEMRIYFLDNTSLCFPIASMRSTKEEEEEKSREYNESLLELEKKLKSI